MEVMMLLQGQGALQSVYADFKRAFDTEGRGLTLLEFVSTFLNNVDARIERQPLVKALVDLFEQIDVNGDRSMEWSEFMSFCIEAGMAASALRIPRPTFTFVYDARFKDNINHGLTYQDLAYHPEIDCIIGIEGLSRHVRIYDGRLHLLRTLNISSAIKKANRDVDTSVALKHAIVPGNRTIAVLLSNHTVAMWTIGLRGFIYNGMLPRPDDRFVPVTMHFDKPSKQILLGCADGTILTYYPEQRRQSGVMLGHTDVVLSMASAPSRRTVVTASLDGHVLVWDMERRNVSRTLRGHDCTVQKLIYVPQTDVVYGLTVKGEVIGWDMALAEVTQKMVGPRTGSTAPKVQEMLLVHTNPPRIFTLDAELVGRLWEITDSAGGLIPCVATIKIDAMVGTNPTQMAMTIPARMRTRPPDIWMHEQMEPHWDEEADALDTPTPPGIVGDLIIAAPRLHRCVTMPVDQIDTPAAGLYCPAITGFVSANVRDVCLWDGDSSKRFMVFPEVSTTDITSACFDDRARKMFVGRQDGLIQAINLSNGSVMKVGCALGQQVAMLLSHGEKVTGRAAAGTFANTRSAAAATSARGMVPGSFVSDEGEVLRGVTLADSLGQITALKYHNVSRCLIAASTDGSLAVYDDEPQNALDDLRVVLYAHPIDITAMAVSEELSLIVTGDRNGTVRCWDFQDLKLMASLDCHNSTVTSITCCGALPLFFTADAEGNVFVFTSRGTYSPFQRVYAFKNTHKMIEVYDPIKEEKKRADEAAQAVVSGLDTLSVPDDALVKPLPPAPAGSGVPGDPLLASLPSVPVVPPWEDRDKGNALAEKDLKRFNYKLKPGSSRPATATARAAAAAAGAMAPVGPVYAPSSSTGFAAKKSKWRRRVQPYDEALTRAVLAVRDRLGAAVDQIISENTLKQEAEETGQDFNFLQDHKSMRAKVSIATMKKLGVAAASGGAGSTASQADDDGEGGPVATQTGDTVLLEIDGRAITIEGINAETAANLRIRDKLVDVPVTAMSAVVPDLMDIGSKTQDPLAAVVLGLAEGEDASSATSSTGFSWARPGGDGTTVGGRDSRANSIASGVSGLRSRTHSKGGVSRPGSALRKMSTGSTAFSHGIGPGIAPPSEASDPCTLFITVADDSGRMRTLDMSHLLQRLGAGPVPIAKRPLEARAYTPYRRSHREFPGPIITDDQWFYNDAQQGSGDGGKVGVTDFDAQLALDLDDAVQSRLKKLHTLVHEARLQEAMEGRRDGKEGQRLLPPLTAETAPATPPRGAASKGATASKSSGSGAGAGARPKTSGGPVNGTLASSSPAGTPKRPASRGAGAAGRGAVTTSTVASPGGARRASTAGAGARRGGAPAAGGSPAGKAPAGDHNLAEGSSWSSPSGSAAGSAVDAQTSHASAQSFAPGEPPAAAPRASPTKGGAAGATGGTIIPVRPEGLDDIDLLGAGTGQLTLHEAETVLRSRRTFMSRPAIGMAVVLGGDSGVGIAATARRRNTEVSRIMRRAALMVGLDNAVAPEAYTMLAIRRAHARQAAAQEAAERGDGSPSKAGETTALLASPVGKAGQLPALPATVRSPPGTAPASGVGSRRPSAGPTRAGREPASPPGTAPALPSSFGKRRPSVGGSAQHGGTKGRKQKFITLRELTPEEGDIVTVHSWVGHHAPVSSMSVFTLDRVRLGKIPRSTTAAARAASASSSAHSQASGSGEDGASEAGSGKGGEGGGGPIILREDGRPGFRSDLTGWYCVTCGADSRIFVWDLYTGELMGQLGTTPADEEAINTGIAERPPWRFPVQQSVMEREKNAEATQVLGDVEAEAEARSEAARVERTKAIDGGSPQSKGSPLSSRPSTAPAAPVVAPPKPGVVVVGGRLNPPTPVVASPKPSVGVLASPGPKKGAKTPAEKESFFLTGIGEAGASDDDGEEEDGAAPVAAVEPPTAADADSASGASESEASPPLEVVIRELRLLETLPRSIARKALRDVSKRFGKDVVCSAVTVQYADAPPGTADDVLEMVASMPDDDEDEESDPDDPDAMVDPSELVATSDAEIVKHLTAIEDVDVLEAPQEPDFWTRMAARVDPDSAPPTIRTPGASDNSTDALLNQTLTSVLTSKAPANAAATQLGPAAVAVLAMSGFEATGIAAALAIKKSKPALERHRRALGGNLALADQIVITATGATLDPRALTRARTAAATGLPGTRGTPSGTDTQRPGTSGTTGSRASGGRGAPTRSGRPGTSASKLTGEDEEDWKEDEADFANRRPEPVPLDVNTALQLTKLTGGLAPPLPMTLKKIGTQYPNLEQATRARELDRGLSKAAAEKAGEDGGASRPWTAVAAMQRVFGEGKLPAWAAAATATPTSEASVLFPPGSPQPPGSPAFRVRNVTTAGSGSMFYDIETPPANSQSGSGEWDGLLPPTAVPIIVTGAEGSGSFDDLTAPSAPQSPVGKGGGAGGDGLFGSTSRTSPPAKLDPVPQLSPLPSPSRAAAATAPVTLAPLSSPGQPKSLKGMAAVVSSPKGIQRVLKADSILAQFTAEQERDLPASQRAPVFTDRAASRDGRPRTSGSVGTGSTGAGSRPSTVGPLPSLPPRGGTAGSAFTASPAPVPAPLDIVGRASEVGTEILTGTQLAAYETLFGKQPTSAAAQLARIRKLNTLAAARAHLDRSQLRISGPVNALEPEKPKPGELMPTTFGPYSALEVIQVRIIFDRVLYKDGKSGEVPLEVLRRQPEWTSLYNHDKVVQLFENLERETGAHVRLIDLFNTFFPMADQRNIALAIMWSSREYRKRTERKTAVDYTKVLSRAQIQEYTAVFNAMDTDRSGAVSFEEIRAMLAGGSQAGESSFTLDDMQKTFTQYDSDKTGTLDKDEYLQMMAELHVTTHGRIQ